VKLLSYALLFSLVGATSISVGVTLWEWLENPSGIYHDGTTTHWQIVYETAFSWLIPTTGYLFLLAVMTQLIWHGIAKLRERFR
jgi:hypothetical protein